ncbi:PRC-barrel domain-containing protein [Actinoplanes sp. NPDC049802]|uniref:PRC-barrel domain-containing protein n=1 Tax=Actinoplanes sp. NPDC049802 TaxID=3154742 RepID=UPI00340DBD4C
MIAQEHIPTLYGREVFDRDGDKIGEVGAIWTDATGHATWASVRTGLFGLNESLIPLQDVDPAGDRLVVPFDKETVKDAPNVDADADEPLDADEIARLYTHYGLHRDDNYHAHRSGTETGRRNQLRKYAVTEYRETLDDGRRNL